MLTVEISNAVGVWDAGTVRILLEIHFGTPETPEVAREGCASADDDRRRGDAHYQRRGVRPQSRRDTPGLGSLDSRVSAEAEVHKLSAEDENIQQANQT